MSAPEPCCAIAAIKCDVCFLLHQATNVTSGALRIASCRRHARQFLHGTVSTLMISCRNGC
jgi:hypothetical protein